MSQSPSGALPALRESHHKIDLPKDSPPKVFEQPAPPVKEVAEKKAEPQIETKKFQVKQVENFQSPDPI